ncbi:MAG TPA: hypothetical protein VFD73_07400, partial [Gemmatimonadales bacterium]|nr:hypothetical protein [Gemmatimonadales bacterium]
RQADSLAQIQFTACSDSVRTQMIATVAAKPTKKKRKKHPVVTQPSEELIANQIQAACGQGTAMPQPVVAVSTPATMPVDSGKQPKKPEVPAAAVTTPSPAAQPEPARMQDTTSADSTRKSQEMEMSRETFAYSGAARDPFSSLLNLAKNGPELADLQLVGIYQNLRSPAASVAVFREKNGGKRHKLRAGDQLGRSRLVQIRERDVVFTIEDFGFERQETLSLRKQEDVTP